MRKHDGKEYGTNNIFPCPAMGGFLLNTVGKGGMAQITCFPVPQWKFFLSNTIRRRGMVQITC